MSLLGKLGRMGQGMADNAKFYGAGSNAAVGAATGAGMTAANGGDMGDIGSAALMGGLGGGAMTMGGKLPAMLGALAGPVASFVQLLKQQHPDAPDEAILRAAIQMAQQQQGQSPQGGMPPGGAMPPQGGDGMMG